jgi:cytochrome c553
MNRNARLALLALFAGACQQVEHGDPFPTNQPLLCTNEGAVQTRQVTRPPPALSGGTLLVARAGHVAVAADADRDRIVIVDLDRFVMTGAIALTAGDEPGRLVEDGSGMVHVILRAGGAVATIDPIAQRLVVRRDACSAPRGIAYRRADDRLFIACAGGELVSMPAGARGGITRTFIASDLRDVVIGQAGELFVSRLRSAELITVDETGAITARRAPGRFSAPNVRAGAPFSPAVAWRTVAFSSGVLMVHQRGMDNPVNTQDFAVLGHGGNEGGSGVIQPGPPGTGGGGGGGSSYGGDPSGGGGSVVIDPAGNVVMQGCSNSIVHTTVSFFPAGANVPSTLGLIAGAVLPVDIAVDPTGTQLAMVAAGNTSDAGKGDVFVMSPNDLNGGDCLTVESRFATGQPIAAQFTPGGRLFVQTREPAQLVVPAGIGESFGPLVIPLGGEARFDPGHDLFHRNSGGNIACASCHPEGGDDGRTWVFDFGPRRTQNLRGGVLGTEPFHWTGDQPTIMELVNEVFTRRMGGSPQSCDNIGAVASWVDTVPRVSMQMPAAGDAGHGRQLFNDPSVGCAGCHTPPKYSNNGTYDVGTRGIFQVPRLIGVAQRGPWIHDGCAQTLRDRFDPSCGGGDMHGHTSQLSSGDVDDLVAFLHTL